ncbi:MAG: SLC13 family permease [Gemmobacter sp.]|nr:SLC13 family permease [Gemmobacter sp.]
MPIDQIIIFSLFFVVLILFGWGIVRYDIVAFGALLAGVLLGVVPTQDAFSGFGHPATLIVAMVLVVSAGLTRSGAVMLITQKLMNDDRPVPIHVAVFGALGAAMSAFMNNIAALALLMPVDMQAARKAKRAAGLTLMPLAFATILGGMVTLIGTPPNILVALVRQEQTGTPFGMFDFAPVGLVVAVVGVAYVALIGWRFIPQRGDGLDKKVEDLADYVTELLVAEGSKLIGKTLAELESLSEKSDIAVLSLLRGNTRGHGVSRYTEIAEGDRLLIEAGPTALEEFRLASGLDYPEGGGKAEITGREGQVLIEAIATETSRIVGRTALSIGLGWRRQTVLMGISRRGRTIRDNARSTQIEAGDILLLLAPAETAADVTDWLGCLPVEGRSQVIADHSKAWMALGLFAAAIAATSLGLTTMPIALGVVVVGYAITGILPVRDLYTHIDWPVIVLLGSMIPLGFALDSTGGTDLIASGLISVTGGLPAWVSLLVLMVITMTLSDVLNNNATTLIAAPVGVRVAEQLGVNPDPFLMAVAVAASCAFLTPIGHQNNTLILGPGGYHFGDYWRMGLPLEIIVIAVGLPMILLVWPL